MTDLSLIPFRAVPGQSALFLDYLDLAPGALAFYSRPPRLEAMQVRRAPGASAPRDAVCAVLRRQNTALESGPAAMANIDRLAHPDCLAVVTGQQVGLFMGPLYTIYKTLTAVCLSQQLSAEGIPAVPLFWMDSEDHDLPEVTHCTVLDGVNPRSVDYQQTIFGPDADSGRPVGGIEFPGSIERAVADYAGYLPEGRWKEEVLSALKSCYRPGATFTSAFGRLLAHTFRSRGVILFDPHDEEAKRLLPPLYSRVVRQTDELRAALTERSRRLEQESYHAQVAVLDNSTVLFLHQDQARTALVRDGSGFVTKNGSARFDAGGLERIARESPERLSPNVLLRPVVQDYYFPTAAYVAGPAEVAYFAQAEVIYRTLEQPMPVIWPRASFTLIEPEAAQLMDAGALQLTDCFSGKHHLVERLAAGNPAAAVLDRMRKDIEGTVEQILPRVTATDPSLGPAFHTGGRKMVHSVEGLRSKFVHLQTRQNAALLETAGLLSATCYPNRSLQERQFGVHPFTARYGPELLDVVQSSIPIGDFSHIALRIRLPGPV